MLFTDLRGSTSLGRRFEVELFADLLSRVRLIWHDIAKRHGGLVVRTQGDGALIVFGHPESAEDDGRRAVEAALEMHEEVRRLGKDACAPDQGELVLRSGLHAGIVLLDEGDVERGRLDLSGDAVHIAAHLQRDAPADGIVASTDVLGPYARLFALGDEILPPPSATGVRAVTVLGHGTAVRRFDAMAQRGLTPFIGRAALLDALAAFVAAEPVGEAPACLVVQAGPGLGKTRLLEQFLAERMPPGWRVLRGSCESQGAARPLQAFLPMLGDAPPLAEPESAFELLRTACAPGPTLIVIDDWQWADDANTRLLLLLLRAPQVARVLLAARPREDGSDWIADAPHIALAPFDAAQTEEAVRRWLPAADPFLAARIHEQAGGVPLYVEELCHSAAADELWRTLDGSPGSTGWLGALVASRLARLPERQAAVVRTAAVIGNVVPRALLAECCDEPPSQPLLQRLADADFLYPDETTKALRFKHGITREAIYQSIGLFERTALHRRIEASLLASRDGDTASEASEALAYHARGSGHWELACDAGEHAGDRASAAHAMDSARRHYRSALDALDRLPTRSPAQEAHWCALAAKLGFACVFDPLSLPDGLAIFERAVLLTRQRSDKPGEAQALYWLGYMLYAVGRFREAEVQTRAALAVAQSLGDERLIAQVEATLGQVLAAASDYAPAIVLMERALESKRKGRRRSSGFAVGSAYTLGCLGSVHADRGDFTRARSAFDEALALLGESTHPVVTSTRNWIAIALCWQGRWDEARQVAAESVRVATGTRALLLLACSRAVLGYVRWNLGDDDGLEQLRESVRWMSARRCDFFVSLFQGWIAEAAAAADREEELRAAVRIVAQRARQGERLGEAAACRALALRAARRSRSGDAGRWLSRADFRARQRGSQRELALNAALRELLECTGAAGPRPPGLPQPYAGLIPSTVS